MAKNGNILKLQSDSPHTANEASQRYTRKAGTQKPDKEMKLKASIVIYWS